MVNSFSLNINPHREVVIYRYISYSDIVSKTGGLKAAFTPVLRMITPLFMLAFLLSLAGVIQESDTLHYRDELLISIKTNSSEEVADIDSHIENMATSEQINYLSKIFDEIYINSNKNIYLTDTRLFTLTSEKSVTQCHTSMLL